jgi:hypothetical protein
MSDEPNLTVEARTNLTHVPYTDVFKEGERALHQGGDFNAHHHKYVYNDMPSGTGIDPDVVAQQSREAIKANPGMTIIVHHHRHGELCDTAGFIHDAYGTSLASAHV